ncbi:glutamine synthetase family protein [Leptolyngbya sp. FACHB-16]|uniref:glutamine synthetase family protein n=1 Tax=unclassified Leptolyngbya TaxID=2650499 RepID=UPI0016837A20|nr:glutamine synthetase family protein [Leptolyngbya sp. FACHB-16]MBD2157393.1 glutamine synthetase [Leptolyngbya sp. FACHB-16]
MTDSVVKYLSDRHIRFVRLLWCDNGNIIRGKAFHTGMFEEHQEHGIGISMGQQGIPATVDAVTPDSGLGPVGEVWLKPDWSTLAALPYTPGHARVLADLTLNNEPWPLCPRAFLRRMVARAEAMNLQVKAAFESEFYLLRRNPEGNIVPGDTTAFATTQAMDLHYLVIDEIAEALINQGVPVERYYPESGPGQQEITVRYGTAMQAADRHIVYRETVRGIALRHGIVASFLPKIFADAAGSGCHLHLSLWRQDENLFPTSQGRVSPLARQFVAGILHHLPALMAITTPTTNSYRRLKPHYWSGAFRCWGYDNREAAVRIPGNPVPPSPTHLELKTVDASANPYLALGAVIAAGLDGIIHQWEPGEAIAQDPGLWSDAEREQRGIDPLPQSLGEAIAHLQQNTLLLEALGAPLAQAFLAVRQAEWQTLKEASLEEEVKLLVDKY